MIIEIIDDSHYLNPKHYQLIEEIIEVTAKRLALDAASEVDITIVDNQAIQTLNAQYRGIDRPTDVLSFALTEYDEWHDYPQSNQTTLESVMQLPRHLGDIIISYPKVEEQAVEYGHSFERELAFLTVHGFLHLNGYDHQTKEEEETMFALQNEVLTTYGLLR